jgi:hypothetical protein
MDNKLSEGIKLLMQSSIIFIYSTTFRVDPKKGRFIAVISMQNWYHGMKLLQKIMIFFFIEDIKKV